MPKIWTDEIGRLWRAPDEPMPVTPAYLAELEAKGGYVAEAKHDGLRVVALIDESGVAAFSAAGKRQSLSPEALGPIERLGFPSGTALDLRWASRVRPSPAIFLLDILYSGWEWQGNRPHAERAALLDGMRLPRNVERPERTTRSFYEFFEAQVGDGDPRTVPTTGIVLKHRDSTLVGQPKSSARNPRWCEVLWRQGPNGQDVIHRRRS